MGFLLSKQFCHHTWRGVCLFVCLFSYLVVVVVFASSMGKQTISFCAVAFAGIMIGPFTSKNKKYKHRFDTEDKFGTPTYILPLHNM